MKIDKKVAICSPGVDEHTMLHIVRHPDGSIYVNAHKLGLFRSDDQGETWKQIPLKLPDAPPDQDPGGFGITRDGHLWVVHQTLSGGEEEMFISHSADGGKSWKTRQVDFGRFSPGGAGDPYVTAGINRCYVNFIERPDGTLMFSCSMRYPCWNDYTQKDPSRPGFGDRMIRSTDGGETWGDPTIVHQHATETHYAVDPADPDHILAASRKQRPLLPGEDRATVEKLAGCPPGSGWPYKGGLLLESTDGGRSFGEVPDSYLGYYSHRGAILWTRNNVVVVTHQNMHGGLLARISLDGGKTWVDDTKDGTPSISKSKGFVMMSDHSFTAPTLELSANCFLTVCCSQGNVEGLFWHVERGGGDENEAVEVSRIDIMSETAKQEIGWTHYVVNSPGAEIRCYLGEAVDTSGEPARRGSSSILWIVLESSGCQLADAPPDDMRTWGNSPRHPLGDMLRGGSRLLVLPIDWPRLDEVAARIRAGEDIFGLSIDRIRRVASCAIARGWAGVDRIVLAGCSRFGFLALDAMAHIPDIAAAIALKPATYWPYVREFEGMDDDPIIKKHDLRNLAERFPPRPVLLLPAYADTRAGTEPCREFAECLEERYRRAGAAGKCKLQLLSIPGHGGDPTTQDNRKVVDWLEEQDLLPRSASAVRISHNA